MVRSKKKRKQEKQKDIVDNYIGGEDINDILIDAAELFQLEYKTEFHYIRDDRIPDVNKKEEAQKLLVHTQLKVDDFRNLDTRCPHCKSKFKKLKQLKLDFYALEEDYKAAKAEYDFYESSIHVKETLMNTLSNNHCYLCLKYSRWANDLKKRLIEVKKAISSQRYENKTENLEILLEEKQNENMRLRNQKANLIYEAESQIIEYQAQVQEANFTINTSLFTLNTIHRQCVKLEEKIRIAKKEHYTQYLKANVLMILLGECYLYQELIAYLDDKNRPPLKQTWDAKLKSYKYYDWEHKPIELLYNPKTKTATLSSKIESPTNIIVSKSYKVESSIALSEMSPQSLKSFTSLSTINSTNNDSSPSTFATITDLDENLRITKQ